MKISTRILIVGLLIIELLILALPFAESPLNRPATARAFAEWFRNPNEETRKQMEIERGKSRRINNSIDAVIVICALGNGALITFLIRRKRDPRTQRLGNGSQ